MNARCERCRRVLTSADLGVAPSCCRRCDPTAGVAREVDRSDPHRRSSTQMDRQRHADKVHPEGATLLARALAFGAHDLMAVGALVLIMGFVIAFFAGIRYRDFSTLPRSSSGGCRVDVSRILNGAHTGAGPQSNGSTSCEPSYQYRQVGGAFAFPSTAKTLKSRVLPVVAASLLFVNLWRTNASGDSWGKRELELKVVAPNGSKPGLGRGLLRTLAYSLDPVSLVPGSHSVWSREAWMHDVISGCRVVPEPNGARSDAYVHLAAYEREAARRARRARAVIEDNDRAKKIEEVIRQARAGSSFDE